MRTARLIVDYLDDRITPAGFGLAARLADLAPNYPGIDNRTIDVTVGDFNADGAPDIASIRLTGDVTIYLNNGAGEFTAEKLLPSGLSNGPFGTTLAAGDFNGDSRVDLAVFAAASGVSGMQLQVYPGNGNGTFGAAVPVTGVTGAYRMAVADLDRDGNADLVTRSDDDGVTVLLGRRGGLLDSPVAYPMGGIVLSLAVGDVNRDGRPDVVAARYPDGQLAVRLGIGGGVLGPLTTFPALTAAQAGNGAFGGVGSVGLGDFTSDGIPDAVVTGYPNSGPNQNDRTLFLLPGRGDGSFGSPTQAAAGFQANSSAVIADFDGDGHADVAFSGYAVGLDPNQSARGAIVLLGNGAGGFAVQNANVGGGGIVDGLASADFNRDGKADVVVASGVGSILVATAGSAATIPVSGGTGGQVQQYQATGEAIGGAVTPFPAYTGTVRTAWADLTGDGVPDLVAGTGPGVGSRVVVLDGATATPVAAFSPFEDTFLGGVYVAAADLNGDGKAEVVVTPDQSGGPVVAIYDGSALAGGKNDAAQLTRFFGIDDPNFRGGARAAVGDISGDTHPDLIVAAGFGGGPRVAIYDGRTAFAPQPQHLVSDFFVFEQTLRNGVYVAAGDLNGDGAADLVVGGGPGGGPRVLALSGRTLSAGDTGTTVVNFFAGDPQNRGGVRVAIRSDVDGRQPLLVTGSGENEAATVRVYLPATARSGGVADQTIFPFSSAVLADGVYVG